MAESNFIGEYFRNYISIRNLDRKKLVENLGFNYASNIRMLYAFFKKPDRLWHKYEVKHWCKVLNIPQTIKAYEILLSRAGKE